MPVFEFQGLDRSGKAVKGVREADNPRALRSALQREGILLTEVVAGEEAAKRRKREVDLRRIFRRVSKMEVAIATRQLATLTRAAIPLVQALSALIDQTDNPDLKTTLTTVRERVNEGVSFADALKEHPKYFTELYVNMVNSGEQAGTLEQVLARLADFTERQIKLRNKITAALAYPAFMMLFACVMVWIMLVVVVPKVRHIFESFGRALPWYTTALITVSTALKDYWWVLLILIVGAVWGFTAWRRSPAGRARWDAFTLRVPIFGRLARMLAISRFSRTLSTLLSSGVPIMRALDITKHVLNNVVLMKVVEEARESIREGESIAGPLARSGKFDPIVTHMVAIGEKGGQLEEMLLNVAEAYDAQVDARINTLTSLLEPLAVVLMGGAMGAIAFSILSPLMQMNQFVQ